MATTDINGMVFYETTDNVTPLQNVLNGISTAVTNAFDSTDRIFEVADATARDALYTARGAPLTVARSDTNLWERNTGSGWFETALPHVRSRVVRSTAQSIPNTTATAISFSSADSHGLSSMWNVGSPTQITIPWDGWWTLTANVGFATNATGYRIAWIQSGGSTRLAESLSSGITSAPVQLSVACSVWLASSTVITLQLYQTSGSALNTATTEVVPTLSVVSS